MNAIAPINTPPRGGQGGFTLVELMVALALSMILVVVMLKTQGTLAQQTVRNSDSEVRDNESRNAVDAIGRAVSGAGFVLGGAPYACNQMFTYNQLSTSPSLYFTHHPVDALPASSGLQMQFAQGLTLNYPASTAIPSDVLIVTTSKDANQFDGTNAPLMHTQAAPAGSAIGTTPTTDGTVPIAATTGLQSGHIAVLQVPLGSPQQVACFRVPMTTVSPTPIATVQSTGIGLMPGTYYAGYAASEITEGLGTMTDSGMVNGSQFVDLGVSPSASTVVFYIDNATYGFPTLMMGTYQFKDDTLDTSPGNGTLAVAAGVISLQVRFGVDPGKTGAVTAYETAANVTTNKHWPVVRTTKVLIVSRSLADDTDPTFQTTSAIPACTTGQVSTLTKACIPTGTPIAFNFSPITSVGSTFTKRRYAVNTFEIANRNVLWNCDGSLCAQ